MVDRPCLGRCSFPLEPSSSRCFGECIWGLGHENALCACIEHVHDHRAPLATQEQGPEVFPAIVEAAASRGLHAIQALALWHAGYRNTKEILNLGASTIFSITGSGGAPSPQKLGTLFRVDHPVVLQQTARGSRVTMVEAIATQEGRNSALDEVNSLRETVNSRRTSDSFWHSWCEVMRMWDRTPSHSMSKKRVSWQLPFELEGTVQLNRTSTVLKSSTSGNSTFRLDQRSSTQSVSTPAQSNVAQGPLNSRMRSR